MSRKRKILLSILTLLLIVIAFGIYYFFIREVEAEENKLSVPPLQEQSVVYLIDSENSVLDFTIETNINDVIGTFDIVGDRFELAFDTETEAWQLFLVFEVDGRTVDTGAALVDEFIKLGFQSDRFPIGRFVGQSEATIEDISGTQEIEISGELELSGVVNPISLPIQFEIVDDTLRASAVTQIDGKDFGVDFPSAIGSSVMDISLNIVAIETDESILIEETPSPEPTSEN